MRNSEQLRSEVERAMKKSYYRDISIAQGTASINREDEQVMERGIRRKQVQLVLFLLDFIL